MATATIVVGVDGSEGSARALEWCRRVAPKLDAKVVVVHAFQVPAYTLPLYNIPAVATHYDEWLAEVRAALAREWVAPLGDVPHRVELLEGPPAQVILDVADHEDADLVVVGSRGRGRFAELVLGSVSHQLSHLCTRPLVIVPPARR